MRFIVIGAHALAVLGRPRNTGDLDVFVDSTAANVKRLKLAIEDFFESEVADEIFQLTEPDKMIRLGREPVRIDVVNRITGVTFDEAWRGSLRRRIDGKIVRFIGRREFIKNKRATAAAMPGRRAKDLLDIALLEESDE